MKNFNECKKRFDALSAYEYFEGVNGEMDDEKWEKLYETDSDLTSLVGQIIALQISIVVLRGEQGFCGSNGDHLHDLLNEKKIKFSEFNLPPINPNYFF